jgi:hypothetical protein
MACKNLVAAFIGISSVLVCAPSASAAVANSATGNVHDIWTLDNGQIVFSMVTPPVTSPPNTPFPCQAEGQVYAYTFVILSTAPARAQMLATLMAALLSGRTVIVIDDTATCSGAPYFTPVVNRVNIQ